MSYKKLEEVNMISKTIKLIIVLFFISVFCLGIYSGNKVDFKMCDDINICK